MTLKTFVFIFVLGDSYLKIMPIRIILACKSFKNVPFFINKILESLGNHIFFFFAIRIETFDMIQYETKQRRPSVIS